MLEILLSMAIFAIGFAMVATIFPSAVFLQKQTADAVQGRVMEDNITSLLAGRKFKLSDASNNDVYHLLDASGDVQPWNTPVSSMVDADPTNDVWMPADRSYPTNQIDLTRRRYYWVPLFRNGTSPHVANNLTSIPDWTVYVFVLQADGRTAATDGSSLYARSGFTYANQADGWMDRNSNNTADATPTDTYSCPGVFSELGTASTGSSTFSFTPNTTFNAGLKYLRPGDQVLDNNGNIYTIATADPAGASVTVQGTFPAAATALWLAQPPAFDAVSPVLRILTITGDNCIQ